MTPIDLLIIALATWYLVYCAVNTKGPFGLFSFPRNKFPHGGLLSCEYCLSVWVALLFYLLYTYGLQPIVYVFAIAGGAMLYHRWVAG